MSYIGSTPTTQSFIAGTDYFSGTGSQTAFTLSRSVVSVNDIQATVNNVVQVPNDAYTVSGTTITFTSAPSAGTNNVYVRYLSTTTQAITPSQNTVSWNTLDTNTQQDLGISYKNKIINGNMAIDQRYAGTATANTINDYVVDRWFVGQTATGKLIAQQNAGSVTPPAGYSNYLGVTSQSAYSIGVNDIFRIFQTLEGFNTADLAWGTNNAKTITVSFWVRSSLTGVFGGSINGAPARYPFTYTINAANTWEQKAITIPGPTSFIGWSTTNLASFSVIFGLGVGSNFSGTAGTWTSTNFQSATGATSVVGTNGATWYVTGVQLEVGTQATTFTTAGGSYGAELALCQRYYQKSNLFRSGSYYAASATTVRSGAYQFVATMRAVPSITFSSTSFNNASGISTDGIEVSHFQTYCNTSGAGAFTWEAVIQASAEL